MQAGYCNSLKSFSEERVVNIVNTLKAYVHDAGESQIRAWQDSIRILQKELSLLIEQAPFLKDGGQIILEYTIPLESRRADVVLLLNGVVLVIEFKGRLIASDADIDQANAYARDLRAYHKCCANTQVKCLLVLTRSYENKKHSNKFSIVGPDHIAEYCLNVVTSNSPAIPADIFLSHDSYQPLPSLIKAARELFKTGELTRIHRAAVATQPTLHKCSEIIHLSAQNKRRALILISGVPGAGKTLVGLQLG